MTFISKAQRPEPDAIEVVKDFGLWTVAHFERGRFRYRVAFSNQAAAKREAERLLAEGLRRYKERSS